MAYERNTAEGIKAWLSAELSTPGWNSSSIAKSLTEDVMNTIIENYNKFDTKIRQAIILSTVYMRKGDLLSLGDGLNKVLQLAINDKDDFVKTTAHVLLNYPSTQTLDLKVDTWSDSFKNLLANIGTSIQIHGFNFHPLQDLILQPCARTTPTHVSDTYATYKSTHKSHFTLTKNQNDIISAESRHARFKELVELEERSEQAEQQQAQVVAQKRAGAELQSKAKRVASPTNNLSNPFPFPPMQQTQPNRPRPVVAPPAGSSSLFTKRPARPVATAGGGGGSLFIKPPQRAGGAGRPVPRAMPGLTRPLPTSNVPRGLQREQKTQMLDFNAASEIEQSAANARKQAEDAQKALQEAKRQELLEKRQRAAADKAQVKREREEVKREREEAKRIKQAVASGVTTQPPSPTSQPTSPRASSPRSSPAPTSRKSSASPVLVKHEPIYDHEVNKSPTQKLTTF